MTRYTLAVLVFSGIFVAIGIALLVRTAAAGGGVVGYVLGALFMPALVAVRRNAAVQRFAADLTARGKAPLQVLVAVMRKLLHAIYGMLKTDTDFDGEKFRRSAREEG